MVTRTSKANRRRASALWVLVAVVLVGLGAVVGSGVRPALATSSCAYSLNQSSYSGTEGSAILITVNRSGSSCDTRNVQLDFAGTGAHPAVLGTNFGGSATFQLGFLDTGPSSVNYSLPTIDDDFAQHYVNVTLSLPGPANGDTLSGTNPALITIIDNDAVTFSFAQNYSVNENGVSVQVTVLRTGPLTPAANVDVSTIAGSALAGSDYTTIAGQTLNFPVNQPSRTFNVFITNDTTAEPQESFSLHLSNATIGTVGGDAIVTINDDDGPGSIQFGQSNYGVVEQTGTVSLNVTRVGGGTGAASVTCSTTIGGTANGTDYTAVVNQLLSWSSGDVADKQCVIPILDDAVVDGPKTVFVVLGVPSGATAGAPSSATLTITDNDGTGIIAYQSSTYTAAENGGNAIITLVRSGGTTGVVSADCTTLGGGTATANVDYTAGSFTATFADSVATATCSIPILDDATIEGPETVLLGLSNFTGGAGPGVQSTATLTIADNETAGPSITSISPSFGPTVGGTLVTISGVNFTGASAVHFGTASAGYVINGDGTISANAPAQVAGVYDVTVTTPSGTSANTINDNYTYTDGPTVTFVDPNTGPASGVPATFVTITGTNFVLGGSGMTVRFGGTLTNNFTVTATTTINVVAPAHAAGTFDIVVTTPGGTSPLSVADQFTYTGSSAPVVTGVSPSSGPTGTVVTISGSGFTGVSCPGGITFGGIAAASDGSCVVNGDNTITAKVPANAPGGTIDVRVTGPGGQSLNTSADNFTNTSSQSTYTYTLNFRFTLIGWAGPDNTPVLAALQGTANAQVEAAATPNSIYSSVTAIWTYDTASQSYKGYFPGSENIPGANDFSVFHSGVGYFIAISVQTIQWTVIAG